MNIVVTGANGFIAKNLCLMLREKKDYQVYEVDRNTPREIICSYLLSADFVFHLAGVNRPNSDSEFVSDNVDYTKFILDVLAESGRQIPIMLSSSTQAEKGNAYGLSKLDAERALKGYSKSTGARHYIYRFPNVFGKWCKPNYNSFIATFCKNIMEGEKIEIHDPNSEVTLVYIDDVCDSLLGLIGGDAQGGYCRVPIEFQSTVGEVARIISSFKSSRTSLVVESVGYGLVRALYATYLSYLNPQNFAYPITGHEDERGVFCEILKTKTSGQFSYFTAHPGITRGGHYHHTKTEKFLVVKGSAKFGFRNMLTEEKYSITVSGDIPEIVETVPGWSHNITNIGNDELMVILWANEIFDPENPDTLGAIV